MTGYYEKIRDIFAYNISELWKTDFGRVNYSNWDIAAGIAALVLLVLFVKTAVVIFGRARHHREHSGHFISRMNRQGIWGRVIYNSPKFVLACGMAAVIFSMADPYLENASETKEKIEAQVRVDLVDTSTSMWEVFEDEFRRNNEVLSQAEVARNAHLEFLKLRENKKDLVSFWIFSSNPYMSERFTTDKKLLYLQVYDAPWILMPPVDPNYEEDPENTPSAAPYYVPANKVRYISNEGGTGLGRAFDAIIEYIDGDGRLNEEKTKRKKKAILIITDGEPDVFPGEQLLGLQKRNITPIIIFINGKKNSPDNFPRLIKEIGLYGGRYFDVRDGGSLKRAYEEISKLDSVEVEVKHHASRVFIYQRIAVLGVLLIFISAVLGIAIEVLAGYYP